MSRIFQKIGASARYANSPARARSTELAGALVAACAGTLIGRAAVAEEARKQTARIPGAGSRAA